MDHQEKITNFIINVNDDKSSTQNITEKDVFNYLISIEDLDSIKHFYTNFEIDCTSLTQKQISAIRNPELQNWIKTRITNERYYYGFITFFEFVRSYRDYYYKYIDEINEQINRGERKMKILDECICTSGYDNKTEINWLIDTFSIDLSTITKIFNKNRRYDHLIARICDTMIYIGGPYALNNIKCHTKDDAEQIMAHIIFYKGNLNTISSFNKCHNVFDDLDFHTKMFIHACKYSTVSIVSWLFYFSWTDVKREIIRDEYDDLYVEAIRVSCQNNNISVAQWLATLYNRFKIEVNSIGNIYYFDKYDNNDEDDEVPFENEYNNNNDDDNADMELLNDDELIDNSVFATILQYKSRAYELLGITLEFTNTENETCMICKDTPDDLLKLSCNHYGCINCMATWYKTNKKEKCPYCTNEIIWQKCKKLKNY